MPRFFTGDELGNIKSLRYTGNNLELMTVHDGSSTGKLKGIQAMAIASTSKLVGISRLPFSATMLNTFLNRR